MRIILFAFCLNLFSTLACQDKKFAGGTKNGTADSVAEAPVEVDAVEEDAVDILGQEPLPEVPVKEIEFGGDEVYRIGDGSSGANSACIGEVKSHDLKGTIYYFQFEVLEDDSRVDVSIGKLCGVDQASFTSVALQDDSKNLIDSEITVPIDAAGSRSSPYLPIESQVLKKGIYSIVVTSKNTAGRASKSSAPNADEYDDFVVGKIQIKSDKTVKQIKVYTE